MAKTTHSSNEIEIRADFDHANSNIEFRVTDADEWQATPFQVADAGHDAEKALRLVSDWADAQS